MTNVHDCFWNYHFFSFGAKAHDHNISSFLRAHNVTFHWSFALTFSCSVFHTSFHLIHSCKKFVTLSQVHLGGTLAKVFFCGTLIVPTFSFLFIACNVYCINLLWYYFFMATWVVSSSSFFHCCINITTSLCTWMFYCCIFITMSLHT